MRLSESIHTARFSCSRLAGLFVAVEPYRRPGNQDQLQLASLQEAAYRGRLASRHLGNAVPLAIQEFADLSCGLEA